MSEVNPDPIAKLARFSPAGATDQAELLFAAGRASARTHWGWKAAVAGLLLSNAGAVACLVFWPRAVPNAAPVVEPVPVASPQPVLSPAAPVSTPQPADEPWSYRALRTTDAESLPAPEADVNPAPRREPLTARSGRRGDID